MKRNRSVVALGDLHIPYEDSDAIKLAFKFISDYKPSKIVLGGDIIDFYSISHFQRNPNRVDNLQSEIDKTVLYLTRLRKIAPQAEIIYMRGNHEDRLRKFLWATPELSSLRSMHVEELLHLQDLDIKYTDELIHQDKDIIYSHKGIVRAHSAYTAKALLDKVGSTNVVHFHTHRSGVHRKSDAAGIHTAMESGCLCKLDPEYVKNNDVIANWQQGFTYIEYINKVPFLNHIHIEDKKLVFGKTRYEL